MDRLTVLLLRLIALLPLPAVHALGAAAGWLAGRLPLKMTRIARINIDLCLADLPAAERRRILHACMVETGKMFAENGPMQLWPAGRVQALAREVEGFGAVREAMSAGRGVIIASPHLGCWEMVGMFISTHYTMTTLYRPQKGALNDLLVAGRERSGARLAPADARGVRRLLAVLKEGGMVGILPDQDPGRNGGIFAPFFGVTANTMVLPAKMVRRTGAALFFAWAERLPRGRGYRLHFVPADPTVGDPDLERAATALNAGMEGLIRRRPEQYWWSYPRFRWGPEGRTGLYRSTSRRDSRERAERPMSGE